VVFQNLSLLGICLAVAFIVWRSHSLNVGGAITFILFAYGNWSLGNWQWALPAFCGFAAYVAAWYLLAPRGRPAPGIKVRLATRALLIPFIPLALANSFHAYDEAYGPFLAACGAVLAFSLDTGIYRRERRRGSRVVAAAGLGALAALVTAGPVWLLQKGVPPSALAAVVGAVVLAAAANAAIEQRDAEARRSRAWTAWRFLLAALAGAAVAAFQAAGWVGLWHPR
jgi:peptidoglycan/LPS O-acetylase OafA/YrhL